MLDAYIIEKLKKEKEEQKWEPLPLTVEVVDDYPEIEEERPTKTPDKTTVNYSF